MGMHSKKISRLIIHVQRWIWGKFARWLFFCNMFTCCLSLIVSCVLPSSVDLKCCSAIYIYMGVSKNRGTPGPQIINFNRVFHHKPSILGHPYIYIFIVYIHCLDDIINTCWGLVQKRQQAADDWNDINNNSHNKKYYKQSLSLKWSWMQWQWQWWSSLIFIAIKLIITICCVFKHLLLSPCLIALQCSPISSPKAARNKPGSAKP